MEKKLLAKIAQSQDGQHALTRKLDRLGIHKFESDDTRATSELILTQLINIAEMKHKFAGDIFDFVLNSIKRLPAESPTLDKIVSKATSAHISHTDEFPYHLIDFALVASKSEILIRAAETNDDLLTYVLARLGDSGNTIQNSN